MSDADKKRPGKLRDKQDLAASRSQLKSTVENDLNGTHFPIILRNRSGTTFLASMMAAKHDCSKADLVTASSSVLQQFKLWFSVDGTPATTSKLKNIGSPFNGHAEPYSFFAMKP